MKKRLTFALFAVSLGLLTAPAWSQAGPVKLRFSHSHNTSDSQHIAAVEFAKKVKERTQGGVEIQIFPNNQLGNDVSMVSGVRGGTVDIGATGTPFLSGIVPRLNALDTPYIFENPQHVAKVMDGAIGKSLLDELGNFQIKGLAFWEVGFRSLANSRRPVNKAEDIKGLKVRTTPNPAHIKAFQLLGAAPQPMPYAEVFSALETKAVDGHENPPNVMLSSKMFEVQKYLSLTRHAYTALVVFMNKKKFESLKPEYQKILLEEAAAAAIFQRNLNAKDEAATLAELRKQGMEINEKPDVESIKAIVKDETRKLFIDKHGDALIKAIDAAAR